MKVEHVNITVGDINEAVNFLQTALPSFVIRGEGDSESNGKPYHWVHIGTDNSYVALQAPTAKTKASLKRYADVGTNHIGFEVEDMDSVIHNLSTLGYMITSEKLEYPARRRVYFETSDGLEWEFIEYFSSENKYRNDYQTGSG